MLCSGVPPTLVLDLAGGFRAGAVPGAVQEGARGGAGGASGSLDASNMFKPALARGEVQCIGATTLDEFRQYIEKDGALER